MVEWRLKAYRRWQTMKEPHWPNVHYGPIDYQAASYYSAPKTKNPLGSIDEVDPELLKTYEKLGIPLHEQKMLAGVAVDAIFDSVSVGTTMRDELAKYGIIFCSFGEALREHPELVEKYLGSVVPYSDNYLRRAEQRRVLRRLVRLRAEGRALPHGAVDVLPHQLGGHGPVRAHADRGRRGLVRQLPRGVHRAEAQHQPAARRGRRVGRAQGRDDQVLDRAELVRRRQGRRGWHLQLRHEARQGARERQDLVDAGRDRLGDHVEVSERDSAGRQCGRRVL